MSVACLGPSRGGRSSEQRDWVLSLVGHELRSPLHAVALAAATVREDPSSATAAEMAHRILGSVRRMDRLIRSLLDVAQSRLGAGVVIAPSATSAHEVCLAVIAELRMAHPGREIRLVAEGDDRGQWDRVRLEQVVTNLVSNAIQHGAPGSAVTVRSCGLGEQFALSVHNFGQPIARELIPQVFDPFVRGCDRVRAGAQNLGLGLFIVREAVEAHGGRVRVTSSAAQGTCFVVQLPRGRSAMSLVSRRTQASVVNDLPRPEPVVEQRHVDAG